MKKTHYSQGTGIDFPNPPNVQLPIYIGVPRKERESIDTTEKTPNQVLHPMISNLSKPTEKRVPSGISNQPNVVIISSNNSETPSLHAKTVF